MKLNDLQIVNFGVHENLCLEFDRVTVICGPNDSGKSTVGEAMQWCLTGRARGVDGRGAGTDECIRLGAPAMSVILTAEHPGGGLELYSRQKMRGQAAKVSTLPTYDPDLIQAVLDAPHFLTLPQARQAEILTAAAGVSVSIDDVVAAAQARGMSASAVESLRAGISRRLPAGAGVVTPAIMAVIYENAYKSRAEAKKEAKALSAAIESAPVPATKTEAEIEDLRQAATEAAKAHTAAIAGLTRVTDGYQRCVEAAATAERLAGLLAQMPPPAAQGELIPSDDRVATVRKSVEQAEAAEAQWREKLQAASLATADAHQMEAGMRGQLTAAEAGSGLCDGTIASGKACPLVAKPDPAVISNLRQQVSALQLAISQAVSAEKNARTRWQQAHQQMTQERQLLAEVERSAARSGGAADAKRAQIEQEIADAQALAAKLEDGRRAEQEWRDAVAQAKAQQARTEDALRAAKDATGECARYQARVEALDSLTAEIADWEQIVPAVEPRGILSTLLPERLGPFVERVNATLRRISPYQVRVRAERGVEIEVEQRYRGGPMSPARLSESARLRLGVAFAVALAVETGLGFVVVDRVDALLRGLRSDLMDAIEQVGLESAVLLMSREEPYEAGPGEAAYWLGPNEL